VEWFIGKTRASFEEWKVKIGLEALDLSAEMIPVDSNIQASNQFLTTFLGGIGSFSQQD